MCLLTAFNSFVPDYVLRQKATGAHASFYIVKQLPFPSPQVFTQAAGWAPELLQEWLLPRVMELTYTAWDLESFAQDCGYYGPPYRWDENRRSLLRCELDAALFHIYLPATPDSDWKLARKAEGAVYDARPEQLDELIEYFPTPRDAVSYIMDTFRIVKRKDEEEFGEYRTKRLILEIYDEMAQAIASDQPYQTRLNPPPADPAVAHSPRVKALPLVLPSTARYPQPDNGVYMMRVILSMLQESGGSIDMERLMSACSLLAMPDTLETYAAGIEPDLAHEWRRRFSDQFRPDLFLAKLDDLVQRGEIRLVREDAGFTAIRVSTADLATDPYIEFDARFALKVSDSLAQTEREAFTPMATREEIEARSSRAA